MFTYYFHEEVEHKYGNIFKFILTGRQNWKEVKPSTSEYVHLGDKNSEALMQTYITGEATFVLKHLLYAKYNKILPMPITAIIDSRYMAKSMSLLSKIKTKPGQVVFMKPSDKFTGMGTDITVYKSIQDAISNPNIQKYETWVLQLEIFPPYLINNRKFVMRYFGIVCYRQDKLYLWFSETFRVNLYEHEYKKSDILGQISHSEVNSETGKYTYFASKHGLEHISGIHEGKPLLMISAINQMQMIIKSLISEACKLYLVSNYGQGYAVYGFDFILDENENVFLLEVNEHPLLNFHQQILIDRISIPILTKIIMFIENDNIECNDIYQLNMGKDVSPIKGKTLLYD